MKAALAEKNRIVEEFKDFLDGARVLLLLHRSKDGGSNKEFKRRLLTFHTNTREELEESILKALILKNGYNTSDYRIYLTVNARDLRKAERLFKTRMVNIDFEGGENKQWFYERFNSKWISALTDNGSAVKNKFFKIDIDTPDHGEIIDKTLNWLKENNVEVVKTYSTKNGWHIITRPFNRSIFPKELGLLEVDSLLLLSY
jgi:hypothetical protein